MSADRSLRPEPRALSALGNQGFSIVEILVSLMLVVLVFSLIPMGSQNQDRAKLDEVLSDFRRAVRFSANESILRNAVTRITIDMESRPQEYYVEYSTQGGLALPEMQNPEDLSFAEREELEKSTKDLNSQFQKVSEFSEENKALPEAVQVVGVANVNMEDILQDGTAYIYFYPTGEKDGALMFLSTYEELATLDIPPFENTTFSDYSIYSDADLGNIDNARESKMKELRDEWLKD